MEPGPTERKTLTGPHAQPVAARGLPEGVDVRLDRAVPAPPWAPAPLSTPAEVVRPARRPPPDMAVPPPDEVRAPRAGPPMMPTFAVDPPDEVRAARAAAARPDGASPGDGRSGPWLPGGEVEVRRDHPTRTDIPPLRVDPGRVEVEQEGMRQKRVRVMTTGVFDLLHLGHVHMLEAARALGDELYVIIARDETVRTMKHEPLNPEEVRRQIVERLKPVTKAVLGHVGDIYQSVVDVRPDVIALGFDQKFTEAEVQRKSAEHGVHVRVVRLPQFDHDLDATRKIIERIGERLARKELYPQREG